MATSHLLVVFRIRIRNLVQKQNNVIRLEFHRTECYWSQKTTFCGQRRLFHSVAGFAIDWSLVCLVIWKSSSPYLDWDYFEMRERREITFLIRLNNYWLMVIRDDSVAARKCVGHVHKEAGWVVRLAFPHTHTHTPQIGLRWESGPQIRKCLRRGCQAMRWNRKWLGENRWLLSA